MGDGVHSAADARKKGALFYNLPEHINYDEIDPLIRNAVKRINESGWVWTAESCQGHPDVTDYQPWASNICPYLRLVCHTSSLEKMMGKLVLAMRYIPLDSRLPQTCNFKVFPWVESNNDYEEVLIYIISECTYHRNLGIAAFERFAESLTH